MAIVGDDKDWTWVINTPCPECGFVASAHDPASTAAMVRTHAEVWESALCGERSQTADPRIRSRVDMWSPLEYACHVRDVCRIYNERLLRMLHEDDPLYENWDQDATAIADRYAAQEPHEVADELQAAAQTLAGSLDAVAGRGGAVWDRVGRRSDGALFTITTFLQYFMHDLVHHLWDIGAEQPSSDA